LGSFWKTNPILGGYRGVIHGFEAEFGGRVSSNSACPTVQEMRRARRSRPTNDRVTGGMSVLRADGSWLCEPGKSESTGHSGVFSSSFATRGEGVGVRGAFPSVTSRNRRAIRMFMGFQGRGAARFIRTRRHFHAALPARVPSEAIEGDCT